MREGVIAEDALAVTLLDATHLFLHDLEEVTLALRALIAAGALEAALDIAFVALVVLEVVTIQALCAALIATGTLHAILQIFAALDLPVPVEVEAEGLLDAARFAEVGDRSRLQ